MKRLLILTLLGISGCSGLVPQDYTIEMGGTPGVIFTGSCQVMSGTSSSSSDLAGVVPTTRSLRGTIISCVAQKRDQSGALEIKIKRANGDVVAHSSTYQAYGVVTAAGS